MPVGTTRLWAVCGVLVLPAIAAAQQPLSYARQVKPFLAKYCFECHNAEKNRGDLDLSTLKAMHEGGKNGPVLVPGKPDESLLVRLLEGKDTPKMPPKTAKQPLPDEAAVVRAWIAAGAVDDSTSGGVLIPDIRPKLPAVVPVAALAYRPGGKPLAAGGFNEVVLIDPATGDVTGKLHGQTGKVTALAFSRGGDYLAVASGAPATSGEVRVYFFPPSGIPAGKPEFVLSAHKDIVLDLTFSPDGLTLATCGYDRLIKLWDVMTGKELRTLKDHSDSVYGLAFSPDSKLLASAAADRAVKVWDVATGKRLYTLGEAIDWVYAVAWSPDGKHLAAAGVDKSIRVWEADATGGKLVHSVFAHEGPVTRLAYSADGKTIYSLSEDKTIKAWDAGRMVEKKVYAKQPETALALALRADQKQLALGRYDGALVLLDAADGKVQAEPLPVKPKPPQLTKLSPMAATREQTVRVTFEGKDLQSVAEVTSTAPGIKANFLPNGITPSRITADVVLPANLPAGEYKLGLKGPHGETTPLAFTVDLFTPVAEAEPNESASTAQKIALPISLIGSIGRAGDVDYYRFEAKPGQEVGVQVVLTGSAGPKLEPVLTLSDEAGQVVAESTSGVLGFTYPRGGSYALGIRDREYRGGAQMTYRLHVGDVPVLSSVFPMGLQRGTEFDVHLVGVNLGPTKSVKVKAPADAAPGTKLPINVTTPHGSPLGSPSVAVGEFPEIVAAPRRYVARAIFPDGRCLTQVPPGMTENRLLAVPGTGNGCVDEAGRAEVWSFSAKKGQPLVVEVSARRLGLALDSRIEILDAKGQPVPRAVLRCQAKTFVTFRDHDSAGPNIRMDAWSEFALNDYVYVGSELLRIRSLPPQPDADCIFFAGTNGQRLGYLDTTPTFQSMGTPMYKVTLHPPGTTFPPNGMPVFTLHYRNDDGGPGYGKDSRLFFDPPADGDYKVRVSDARGHGGDEYAYRLTLRPPLPGYTVSFNPTAPAVWKGSALPVNVTADRTDGFEGPIELRLENLPPGFSAPATTIPENENSTAFALFAEPNAAAPPKDAPPLKLVAKALINGQPVVREVMGSLPKVVEPGDLVTTTEQSEVTLKPGGEVWLTVHIERRNGFKGRVPVEVRGLPHGVRVLDIGLNGILITEKETSRRMAIYAEPWVQPTTQPLVILAKREGKNAEHAAKSVLLRVAGPDANK